MILSLVFFTFSFVFYILTTALYMGYWVFKKKWLGQTATAMAFIALASTSMILISRTGESGHAPFSNLWESMMLFIWATNVAYLFVISLVGGLAGIVQGIGVSEAITTSLGWPVLITSSSILIAFGASGRRGRNDPASGRNHRPRRGRRAHRRLPAGRRL